MILKTLTIQNLVLIDNAVILFHPGLNVFSGETGSGKSAIIEALNLISGERADGALIRQGSSKSVVEATFLIDEESLLHKFLEESGIDHEVEEELILRREISDAGKSRAFINQQFVQLSCLRKVGELLIRMVGQHASQHLRSLDQHRKMIDLFGHLETSQQSFKELWEIETHLRSQLALLVNSESQRLREIDACRGELEELDEAAVKEGEEESLFSEYQLLANAEERASLVHEMTQTQNQISPFLTRLKSQFERLLRIDLSLRDTSQLIENVSIEMAEVFHSMNHYESHIEFNPKRLEQVNERLSTLTRIKRKYGRTLEDVISYHEKTKLRLKMLESADVQIQDLEKSLNVAISKTNEAAAKLTEERMKTGKILEVLVTEEIQSLNMPKAHFCIDIRPQPRTANGDDAVEFFLMPNVGEKRIAIKDYASGGELSRLMLALQTVFAGKEPVQTLIFDEIDGNIGGETATIVGKKLKQIGMKHQILCITHFPQVALQADHHLQISKSEKEGRTFSQVQSLNVSQRKKELSRMAGR